MIPTFLGITLIVFLMMKLAPNHSQHMKLFYADGNLSPDHLVSLSQNQDDRLTLSKTYIDFSKKISGWFVSEKNLQTSFVYKSFIFVGQNTKDYGLWLYKILKFDFGYSTQDYQPVGQKILKALPWTLVLNFFSLFIVYAVSLPLGIWSAKKDGSFIEKTVTVKLFAFYSLPTFWLATLLLAYLASGDHLNWFPLGGVYSDSYVDLNWFGKFLDLLWHLALPVLVMSLSGLAFMTRFTKVNFIDVFGKNFIRTAYAKGLSEKKVIYRHAFKNALLPFITLMGTLLPALIGGSVIIEHIFSIPGMGYLSFEAVMASDYNLIMAITSLSAMLTLLGLLIQDLIYTKLDPRIRFE